jgi:hypothetical protein
VVFRENGRGKVNFDYRIMEKKAAVFSKKQQLLLLSDCRDYLQWSSALCIAIVTPLSSA